MSVVKSSEQQQYSAAKGLGGGAATRHRIGLIVPSSNVTVETELPTILGAQQGSTFSFHSSRMRMGRVTPEELSAMNAQRERCVDELADADPDVVLYGCLVAVMVGGAGAHRHTEEMIAVQLAKRGVDAAVLSSAGALIEALTALDARRVALVMPYMKDLAERVAAYIGDEGFQVTDFAALEVPDNAEVACIAPERIRAAVSGLRLAGVDALVVSACVQMPSLSIVRSAEDELGIPVVSAATAGAFGVLGRLRQQPSSDSYGRLLSGAISPITSRELA